MADQKSPTVSFVGNISQGKNAISFCGADGIRVQFDVPEIYREAATQLTAWRGKILNISISLEEDGEKVQSHTRSW